MKTNAKGLLLTGMMMIAAIFTGAAHAASKPVDPRFLSDKPVVKYLFIHTAEKPYDIKCLSWYGGVMEKIVVENKTDKVLTVTFELTNLSNGTVAVPARTTKVNVFCPARGHEVMMELLSNDGNSALSYNFAHQGGVPGARIVMNRAKSSTVLSLVK